MNRLGSLHEYSRACVTYRSWLDDDMVWKIPLDERPGHVSNPWVWIPDAPVEDIAVHINTVDDIMEHLRTIPRDILDRKLEGVVTEREKFSFQPYITGPPSATNIIISEMCKLRVPITGASAAGARVL